MATITAARDQLQTDLAAELGSSWRVMVKRHVAGSGWRGRAVEILLAGAYADTATFRLTVYLSADVGADTREAALSDAVDLVDGALPAYASPVAWQATELDPTDQLVSITGTVTVPRDWPLA